MLSFRVEYRGLDNWTRVYTIIIIRNPQNCIGNYFGPDITVRCRMAGCFL